MPLVSFRAQDAAGNQTAIVLTATVPDPGGPAWLTTFEDVHDAIYDPAVPTVYIGDGVYDIPHHQGLFVNQPGKRIIGQSMQGTVLRATGTRGEMNPTGGGLTHDSTKGVIEINAHGVEIGNLTLTTALTGGRTQASVASTSDPNTYIPAGIWGEGNDWYLHDLIVDKCSFGMQLWQGASPSTNVLKRIHRVVITNWGYRGTLFGHSGYGIYEQAIAGTVEHRDIVMQTGTDFGYHHYGGFSFPATFDFKGVVVLDTGSPLPTGGVGGDSQMYCAKTERLKVENTHTGLYHDHNAALFANNKIGYGSGFSPKKFEAINTWHIGRPDQANQTWQNNSALAWPEGFTITGVKNFRHAADRPAFVGTHLLGGSWHVHYGTEVPAGYELVPGTKTILAPTFGRPPMLIVRPVT